MKWLKDTIYPAKAKIILRSYGIRLYDKMGVIS